MPPPSPCALSALRSLAALEGMDATRAEIPQAAVSRGRDRREPPWARSGGYGIAPVGPSMRVKTPRGDNGNRRLVGHEEGGSDDSDTEALAERVRDGERSARQRPA